MANGLLGYAAAGALAGIGQGMEQQAQQNGIEKREQMLAQLQQQGLIQRLDAQGQMQDQRLAQQDALQQRRLEHQNALETQRESAHSELATRQQDQQHQDRMAEIGATRGSIADQAAASRADAAAAREAARGEVGSTYVDADGYQHIITRGGEDRKLGSRARTPAASNANPYLDADRALDYATRINTNSDTMTTNWAAVADTLEEHGQTSGASHVRATHGIPASAPAAAPVGAGGNGLASPAAAAPTPTTGDVVAPTAGPARPQSKADFDAMPSGTRFVAPDGSIRVKP